MSSNSINIRAMLAIMRLNFRRTIVARIDMISNIIFGVLLGYAMAFLWQTLYENEVISPKVPIGRMVTYAILGSVVTTVFQTGVMYVGNFRIRSGDIVFDILRPVSWQLTLLGEFAGQVLAQVIAVGIPVVVICSLFLDFQAPASILAGIAFVPSLILGALLSFSIIFLIMLLAFRYTQVGGIESALRGFRPLLTGALIPLWFLPSGVANALELLPFPGMTYTPLAIYVGEISGGDIWISLGRQLIWTIAILGTGAYFASRGMKNLSIQGG